MKNKVFLLLMLISVFSFSQNESFSFLATSTTGDIVAHQYYTISYSEEHEQSEWVAYRLTKDMINGPAKRKDNFRPDPKIKTKSAQLIDYKGSGYDRGHLASAADMKLNSTAMSESFFMSNMSPQAPSFNRGAWKQLESLVRTWTLAKGDLYVVTGGVLPGQTKTIGANKVTVPEYYYKIVLLQNEKTTKGIALYMPNEKCTETLDKYVVTIDFVESKTGIDFFSFLPEEIESKIESKVDKTTWLSNTGTSTNSQLKPDDNSTSSEGNTTVRCSATTQKGTQCKRRTTNSSGKCTQHE